MASALLSGRGWLGWRAAGMPFDLSRGKLAALLMELLPQLSPLPSLPKRLLPAEIQE